MPVVVGFDLPMAVPVQRALAHREGAVVERHESERRRSSSPPRPANSCDRSRQDGVPIVQAINSRRVAAPLARQVTDLRGGGAQLHACRRSSYASNASTQFAVLRDGRFRCSSLSSFSRIARRPVGVFRDRLGTRRGWRSACAALKTVPGRRRAGSVGPFGKGPVAAHRAGRGSQHRPGGLRFSLPNA